MRQRSSVHTRQPTDVYVIAHYFQTATGLSPEFTKHIETATPLLKTQQLSFSRVIMWLDIEDVTETGLRGDVALGTFLRTGRAP